MKFATAPSFSVVTVSSEMTRLLHASLGGDELADDVDCWVKLPCGSSQLGDDKIGIFIGIAMSLRTSLAAVSSFAGTLLVICKVT